MRTYIRLRMRQVFFIYYYNTLCTLKLICDYFLGGKSASSFMERCITFIGDNAADCVKTNAFLNLPKEALIKLISSDFVSI